MNLEVKLLNPICIRVGTNSNVVVVANGKEEYPLVPGVMFGGDHYGFILIMDHNGKQKEVVYPTQCKIQAVGIADRTLNVFEDGKKDPWRITQRGDVKHSALGDFTDEFKTRIDMIRENYDMFMGKPTVVNPVRIRIARKPEESVLLRDENIKEDYPLYPGAMLGTVHYGFILLIETEDGTKEVVYPTQNRIDAIESESDILGDVKVFENGKYHPWLFSYGGELKKVASYNSYSRRDNEFVRECYDMNEDSLGYCFALKKKK